MSKKLKFVVRNAYNVAEVHGTVRAAFDSVVRLLENDIAPASRAVMRRVLEMPSLEPGMSWMIWNSEVAKDVYDSSKLRHATVITCEDMS